MTVGEITFDMALSSGSRLQLVDVSGLQPLSFTPPSPEAVERFVSAMNAEPVQGEPLRFAAASLSIDEPEVVVAREVPVASDGAVTETVVVAKTIFEKPAVVADHVDVVRRDAAPPSAVDTPKASVMPAAAAVENPVVEKPVAVAKPVVVETVVAEQPVVERPSVEKPAVVADHVDVVRRDAAPPSVVDTPKASVKHVVAPPTFDSPEGEENPVVVLPVVDKPVVTSPETATVAVKSTDVPVVERAAPVLVDVAQTGRRSVLQDPSVVTAPVIDKPVADSSREASAVAAPVAAPVDVEEPVYDKTVVVDLSQESAKVAAAQAAPVAPQTVDAQSVAASTASARTEVIAETVGKVVEAVAAQILVTPALVKGEGEMIVRLKSDILDGSTIRLTAESGTLSVEISPATQSAQRVIVEAAPRLETALSEHVAAFHHVRVLVKKGRQNEAV